MMDSICDNEEAGNEVDHPEHSANDCYNICFFIINEGFLPHRISPDSPNFFYAFQFFQFLRPG